MAINVKKGLLLLVVGSRDRKRHKKGKGEEHKRRTTLWNVKRPFSVAVMNYGDGDG